MTPEKAMEAAKEITGGAAALAREIGGVTRQAVDKWKVCPPRHVLKVEAAVARAKERLKRAPTKHDLCPDLFPEPRAAGRGAASITKTAKKPRKGD